MALLKELDYPLWSFHLADNDMGSADVTVAIQGVPMNGENDFETVVTAIKTALQTIPNVSLLYTNKMEYAQSTF